MFVILFAALVSPLFAQQYVDVSADMTPITDVFVCVGGSFELNCTVHGKWKPFGASDQLHTISSQENETLPDPNALLLASNISIARMNRGIERGVYTYHPNELTLQLNVSNVTKEDGGTYFCYYHNTSSNSYKSFKIIHVGEPPGKPYPPVCVSYNFLNMSCFVRLKPQRDNIPRNWTMVFNTDGFLVPKNVTCKSQGHSDELTCDLPARYFLTGENYTVTLIKSQGDQQMCNTSTEVTTDFSIVKPDCVRSLQSKVLSSSSTVLKWEYPKYLNYKSDTTVLEYEVLLQSENDWDNRNLKFDHKVGSRVDKTVVRGLVCNSLYHVAVRSRPNSATDDIYWSQWNNATFLTYQRIPKQSTELSIGSYFVIDSEDELKTVVIYWKNPEEPYCCGNLTGYLANLSPTGTDHLHSRRKIQNSAEDGYKIHHNLTDGLRMEIQGLRAHYVLQEPVEATRAYLLKMNTVNNEGQSNETSSIEIPSWTKAKHARVRFVSVEMSEDGPLVSWEMDKNHCSQVTEVTYYWCQQSQDKTMNISYALCKDSFDWLSVPVYDGCSADNYELINSTRGLSDMRFAVSVTVAGVTGGMVWEKFRFKTFGAVPSKPQYQVSSVPDKLTELKITLLYNDYYNLEEGGRPDSFHIAYINSAESLECSEVMKHQNVKMQTFPVDFSNQMMTVGGLEPDTSYAVCGRFSNNIGEGGYGKLQMVETTSEDSGNTNVVVPIVSVVCSLLVLGIIIGLVCGCRRARGYISSRKKVNVPEILDLPYSHSDTHTESNMVKETSVQKIDEHDSGQGSDSPYSSIGTDVEGAADGVLESDIKETTPILTRAAEARRNRLTSSSVASGLSGYLRVSDYGGDASDDDLMSCSDDDVGETNNYFSQKETDHPEMYRRKPRVYATITLDDITLNLDTQESTGDMLEGLNDDDVQNVLDEEIRREESNSPLELSVLPQPGSLYVAAGSGSLEQYSHATVQSGQAATTPLPYSHTTHEANAETSPPSSPVHIGDNSDNTVDVSKAEETTFVDSENSGNSGSATHEVETHGANRNVVESEAGVGSEAGVKSEAASLSTIDSEDPSQVTPKLAEFTVNNNTDIFSDMFDDIMDTPCGFSDYQNPDTLSLGQMSILSNGSDAGTEDSRSIKSFTSADKAGIAEPMDTSVLKNTVLKLCNEINNQFDKTSTRTDSNNEMPNKDDTSTVPIKLPINSTRSVSDSAISQKSQALREFHDKVIPEVPSSTDIDTSRQESGGPCVEVLSYVKAGVTPTEEEC